MTKLEEKLKELRDAKKMLMTIYIFYIMVI